MDDKISFTMKLMILMTIKHGTVADTWGDENDSWRVPVGFHAPYDYKGVTKPTTNAQLRL